MSLPIAMKQIEHSDINLSIDTQIGQREHNTMRNVKYETDDLQADQV